MNLKINLLKPFSDAVGKRKLKIDFDGTTIEELIEILIDKYPKLKNEFYKNINEISEYICVFVNDKSISTLNGIKTDLKNGDEILFFIPISGG